jgi:hypothetical protein
MSDTVCLQEWTSILGNSNSVIQSQDKWVDLPPYQDVALYVEISANSSASLTIETSPTREEVFFAPLKDALGTPIAYTGSGLQGVAVYSAANGAAQLPARFMRWKVSGSGSWTIGFRVWLSVQPPHP